MIKALISLPQLCFALETDQFQALQGSYQFRSSIFPTLVPSSADQSSSGRRASRSLSYLRAFDFSYRAPIAENSAALRLRSAVVSDTRDSSSAFCDYF
ncbi:hypothetical protein L596_014528 [Steinernema carpocapsae]|uniref:Uncharacterized protein n=1 Tax=Steinernema carpocapsae TaxID=34508 RepID=A0A4U5NCE6_STECR|nr:hypothetical protein L596_014528 [Steinernema carpocapsae]